MGKSGIWYPWMKWTDRQQARVRQLGHSHCPWRSHRHQALFGELRAPQVSQMPPSARPSSWGLITRMDPQDGSPESSPTLFNGGGLVGLGLPVGALWSAPGSLVPCNRTQEACETGRGMALDPSQGSEQGPETSSGPPRASPLGVEPGQVRSPGHDGRGCPAERTIFGVSQNTAPRLQAQGRSLTSPSSQ